MSRFSRFSIRSKFHILIFEDCATSQTWGYENREKEQWRRGECSQFQQTRLFNTVAYCTYMKSHVATIRVNIFVHSLYYFYFYFPFPFFLFFFLLFSFLIDVKSIQHHNFMPRLNKVIYKDLVGIITSVIFRQGTQFRIRTKH